MSASDSDGSSIPFADSPLLTYVIPFAGSLLIAAGIGAGVVGAYAPVQQDFGLCGEPSISVYTPERTAELTGGPNATDGNLSLDRIAFSDLTEAEQRAFEEALTDPFGEGEVSGEFANREAFEDGVVIRYEGTTRYATLTATDNCTTVDPLLFPLGLAAIALGTVWILAPPMYRRLARVESGGSAHNG